MEKEKKSISAVLKRRRDEKAEIVKGRRSRVKRESDASEAPATVEVASYLVHISRNNTSKETLKLSSLADLTGFATLTYD